MWPERHVAVHAGAPRRTMVGMGIISRLIRPRTRAAGGTGMPDGIRPPDRTPAGGPLTLSTVFRGVQVLQTAITGLPVVETVRGVRQPDVSRIISRPDPTRTRRDWISEIVAALCLDGNAFVRLDRFDGQVVGCTLLPPRDVTVTDTGDDPAAPCLAYTYNGHTYTSRDIVHLKYLNVPGRLRGLGPISAAREEIESAQAARTYKSRFYTDGSNAKGYLRSDMRITQDVAEQAKAAWKGDGGPGDVKVLGNGLTYVPLDLKPADLQFLESQKFDTTQIARLLGIPASIMLAAVDGSNLTYSNVEQSWIEFADYTLAAYTGEIEEVFDTLLPRGRRAVFDWDSSRRSDTSERYQAYSTAITAGWLTIDEVRAREGLQPLDATQEGQTDGHGQA